VRGVGVDRTSSDWFGVLLLGATPIVGFNSKFKIKNSKLKLLLFLFGFDNYGS
jgi:hypothetical protein